MTEPEPRPAPPPPKPAPPPRAPGLSELFEQSLAAIVDPSVLRRAAARPAPSFGAAGGLALLSGAAAIVVGFAHGLVAGPGLLQTLSPPILAAVGLAALGLYASLALLLAVLLYGAGNGFGGKGEFERGLQAVAMISVLAPAQMLCNWFPAAWIAPALLAAWVAAGALEGLFGAPPAPSRALCALLAAGALGLQFAGRALTGRARDAYAASQSLRAASDANARLAASMTAFTRQAQALSSSAVQTSAPPAPSGLDLLRGGPSEDASAPEAVSAPEGEAPFPGQPQPAPPPQGMPAANALAGVQAMSANAAGMLDAMTPMLDTLSSSKRLGPRQKADIKELQAMMQDLKSQMTAGRPLSNAAFGAEMARYQALLMKVMAFSAQAQPAAPPPPQAGTKQIHLKLPPEGQ